MMAALLFVANMIMIIRQFVSAGPPLTMATSLQCFPAKNSRPPLVSLNMACGHSKSFLYRFHVTIGYRATKPGENKTLFMPDSYFVVEFLCFLSIEFVFNFTLFQPPTPEAVTVVSCTPTKVSGDR